MSLANVQPIQAFPGFQWSTTASPQVQEIITTFNAESLDALSSVPAKEIAWADRGTKVSPGSGIVKVPVRLPSSLGYTPFIPGGTRTYQSLDLAAPVIRVNPWDLNFAWPMVWDAISNNMNLMSTMPDGSLSEFLGAGGLAGMVVTAARAYKAQLVASLFYKGVTSTAMGLTAQALTIPQPGLPNGNALFTNGTDSPQQYAHPFNINSGRFKTLYEAFGALSPSTFSASLVNMTQVPHPSLPNMTMGSQVTDVIGPTWMRSRFFNLAVQGLSLQTQTIGGQPVGAATVNPMSTDILRRFNEDTYIGASGFAPQTFWICPALDSHPYFTSNSNANMTSGPNGGPADMWINISAEGPGKTWCELAAPTKDFTPMVRLYGEGDPLSQSQRRVRMETDLDAGVAAGLYHFVQMYTGV